MYLALVETWRPARPLASDYAMLRQAILAAAIVYLAALAVTHITRRRRLMAFQAATWGVSSAVTLFLILVIAWTWLRGARSRLLLTGASELLAVMSVAVLLHAAWQWVDWQWRSRSTGEPAAGQAPPLTRRASGWAEALAGAALAGCWIALELLDLPHAQ